MAYSHPGNMNVVDGRQWKGHGLSTRGDQTDLFADGVRSLENKAPAEAKELPVSSGAALEKCVYTKQDVRLQVYMAEQARAKGLVKNNASRDSEEGAVIPSEPHVSRNGEVYARELVTRSADVDLTTTALRVGIAEEAPTQNGRIVYSREVLLKLMRSPLCWVKLPLPQYSIVLDEPWDHAAEAKDWSN